MERFFVCYLILPSIQRYQVHRDDGISRLEHIFLLCLGSEKVSYLIHFWATKDEHLQRSVHGGNRASKARQ